MSLLRHPKPKPPPFLLDLLELHSVTDEIFKLHLCFTKRDFINRRTFKLHLLPLQSIGQISNKFIFTRKRSNNSCIRGSNLLLHFGSTQDSPIWSRSNCVKVKSIECIRDWDSNLVKSEVIIFKSLLMTLWATFVKTASSLKTNRSAKLSLSKSVKHSVKVTLITSFPDGKPSRGVSYFIIDEQTDKPA